MENDIYCPEEKICYNYVDFFQDTETLNTNNYNKVYICPYTVNTNGKYPFLLYLLTTNVLGELVFPELEKELVLENDFLLEHSKEYLYNLIKHKEMAHKEMAHKEMAHKEMTEELNDESIIFNGYYEYDNNLYLFFNITDINIQTNENFIYPNCLVLIDEIVNVKMVCNVDIHSDVCDLFIHNENLCFLYNDKNGETYEIPVVSYVNKPFKKINFTYVFGETTQTGRILGPYYYFTNFKTCIENSKQNNNKGLIRFAIFTGVTKYIENNPNDEIDTSETKQLKIKEDEFNEVLTLRMTDYDGNWATTYDSAYLYNVLLDNGEYYKEKNMLVIKNYTQQFPLSYHYISNLDKIV